MGERGGVGERGGAGERGGEVRVRGGGGAGERGGMGGASAATQRLRNSGTSGNTCPFAERQRQRTDRAAGDGKEIKASPPFSLWTARLTQLSTEGINVGASDERLVQLLRRLSRLSRGPAGGAEAASQLHPLPPRWLLGGGEEGIPPPPMPAVTSGVSPLLSA